KPEKINISDTDIEEYYRSNQRDFLIPAQLECDEIAVKPTEAGRQALLDAQARLRQGEKYESVRAALREPLDRRLSPEFQMRIAAELEVGCWSEIIEQPYGLFLLRINKRVPASYLPLGDASLFIVQELESRRAALELEKILNAKLSHLDVEFYF
ncbi:MAG: peptidyl-prolyl cis-trans isomerase, partial [Victivallaceae bacterium]